MLEHVPFSLGRVNGSACIGQSMHSCGKGRTEYSARFKAAVETRTRISEHGLNAAKALMVVDVKVGSVVALLL